MDLQILQFQHRLENVLQIHIQSHLCSCLGLPVCHCGKWPRIPRLCLLPAVRRRQHWSNPRELNKQGKNKTKKKAVALGGEAAEQNCVYRMRGRVCSCSEHRLIPWCPGAGTVPAALLCWVLCDCSENTARVRLVKVLLCWNSVFLILLLRTPFLVNFTFFFTSSIINVLNSVLQRTNEKEWNASSLKWTNTGKKRKRKQQVKFSHLKFQQEYICHLCRKLSGVLPL